MSHRATGRFRSFPIPDIRVMAPSVIKRAIPAGSALFEDYLPGVDESRRGPLLVELLWVERELRQQAAEEQSPEGYSLCFSEHAVLIYAVFGPGPAAARPDPEALARDERHRPHSAVEGVAVGVGREWVARVGR